MIGRCRVQIKHELVSSASTIWPTHFSALFEAYRVDGPALPRNDVILAVNSSGVFLLDSHYDVVVGFHFYDVIYLKADSRCVSPQTYIITQMPCFLFTSYQVMKPPLKLPPNMAEWLKLRLMHLYRSVDVST